MKIAVYEVSPQDRARTFDAGLSTGGSWVRFGNEVVVYSDETPWKGVVEQAARKTSKCANNERL